MTSGLVDNSHILFKLTSSPQCKCVQNCTYDARLLHFQGRSLKAMVVLNFSGLLNWRNETNCGKPDIMPGMPTWLLDLVAR